MEMVHTDYERGFPPLNYWRDNKMEKTFEELEAEYQKRKYDEAFAAGAAKREQEIRRETAKEIFQELDELASKARHSQGASTIEIITAPYVELKAKYTKGA